MGVSFKVSRTGKRYKPNSRAIHEPDRDDSPENRETKDLVLLEDTSHRKAVDIHDNEIGAGNPNQSILDNEVSFILSLYTDGYSIARPEEITSRSADAQPLLHPYDRSSDSFFSAIECGRFPRDVLDEKHCKFVAGSIVCEVKDYRQNASVVHRVSLRISLEDVVKDIPLMSDSCWAYGDLMEVESQILKALQPKLLLDPSPQLDRLCRTPIPSKLCLGLRNMRRKRRREQSASEVTATTSNTQGQEMVVSYGDNSSVKRDIMNKRATLSPNSDAMYSSQMDPSFAGGHTPMRYGTEHLEAEKMNAELNQMRTEMVHFDPQQRQNMMRSQSPWAAPAHKEDHFQKRKSGQSPRMSAQSPLSSKSGELSSGSGGAHFAAASALASQREKSIGAAPPKRRSNSFNKTQAVGSPASVSTNSQLNANSPSVGTCVIPDLSIMDRFLKIDMTVKRFKLLPARNKVDNFPIRKTNTYSPQMVPPFISNGPLCQDFIDDSSTKKLSRSLIGGSMNTCKTRVVNFATPGEMAQGKSRSRLIMMEKPNDGTVAMFYGEVDEDSSLPNEDHLPTLRNSDYADSLAAQLCSLMLRDGFVVEDDRVQPKLVNPPITQTNAPVDRQQLSDAGKMPIQQPTEMNQTNRMLPPGNPQAVLAGASMSMSMPLRMQLEQQQQQQQSMSSEFNQQFQRQHMVNALPHLNTLGGHMSSKASSIQMQMLQQQQTQKQNQMQQQRKLMVGLGTAMGLGNLTSNIVGLGGMSSAVGVRGPISMGHLNQTGLGQQIRGQFNPQDVALYNQKMRLAAQSRPGMLGGQGTNRPMVGPRGNMNPMQRGAMGPPKLMGMYSNQPPQFQAQQFQLQEATSSFPSSPSTIVMPPMNHPSPQQMNQTTMSPQMSSGPIHPLSGDVCPASPQLSSQTLGSVGSITNSPMELPSVNKTTNN